MNGQALDSDPAVAAKQTLEKLELAVPIEPIQLDAFKDQTEKLIELELENESLKAKIDELKDAEVERINGENEAAGIEDPPEVDRDSLSVRVPDEFLY